MEWGRQRCSLLGAATGVEPELDEVSQGRLPGRGRGKVVCVTPVPSVAAIGTGAAQRSSRLGSGVGRLLQPGSRGGDFVGPIWAKLPNWPIPLPPPSLCPTGRLAMGWGQEARVGSLPQGLKQDP